MSSVLLLLLYNTPVERNKLKLQKCNLLRRDWNGQWVDVEPGYRLSLSLTHTATVCAWAQVEPPAVHFCWELLPTNTTSICRHNGASPTCHEIAFLDKTSSDMKEGTQSGVRSKIDLKYILMAWDTYRRRYYYSMMPHRSLEHFLAHDAHWKQPEASLSETIIWWTGHLSSMVIFLFLFSTWQW